MSAPSARPAGLSRQDTLPTTPPRCSPPPVLGTKRPLDAAEPPPKRKAPLLRQGAIRPPKRYMPTTTPRAKGRSSVPAAPDVSQGYPPQAYGPAAPQAYAPLPGPYAYPTQPQQGAYGAAPYPAMMHPAPQYMPAGPAPATYGYPQNMHAPGRPPGEPLIPQNAEEARLLWSHLNPMQQAQFLRLLRSQQGASPATEERREHTDVEGNSSGEYPDVDMTGADEEDMEAADSDKGTGGDSSDFAMRDASPPNSPDPRRPSTFDGLTNEFGKILLEHVQTSHDQINKMMSAFMSQQNEVQERFQTVVANEFRAVHAKVQQVQNPLGFSGRKSVRRSADAAGSRTAQSSSPRKSARVPSSTSEPDPVLQGALTKLQSSVRFHLRKMLKFTTWADLVERQPPLTDEETKTFGTRKNTVICTEDAYRIDFVHDWKRTPFNLHARDLFVQNLLKCIQGGAFGFDAAVVPLITVAHIESALDSHMDYCRRQYREAHLMLNLDSDNEEDAVAKADQREKATREKKRKAINSRKKTLYEARLSVILSMGLSRHAVLFDKLSARNMSGDETDGTKRKLPMAYRIVESRWQSDVFKTFMRALDAMYRQDWERPGGDERATGGNPPRTRISRVGGRVEDGYAPHGLWRNCYNADWLNSLAPYQRRALNIIDASYNFDLAAIFDDGEVQDDDSADEVDGEL